LDQAARGFSFMQDGPLDMRMDPDSGESAAEFLARATETEIADVLWAYGEERMSRRIARAVIARRSEAPLTRTAELADLVRACIGRGEPGKHPATRTFQGLRIFLNRELDDLATGLAAALSRLKPGGRLAIISFHSLEDRQVKQFMQALARPAPGNRRLPAPEAFQPVLALIGGAIRADSDELLRNPRARSAVLRVAEKLA
jgi:16S rRNA (cytosine1402-N4)-methyltransferase